MATLIEEQAGWFRLLLGALGVKKGKIPKGAVITHPDRRKPTTKRKITTDPNEIRKFFEERR